MPRWMPFELYFWSWVDMSGDCWLWQGNQYTCGYGRVHFRGGRWGAHRVSYTLMIGEIQEGLFVCHKCDVKLCVNPAHLFAGTHQDNMIDMTLKGNNHLVNNRHLWANGRYWKDNDAARKNISEFRKSEFSSGKRVVLRSPTNGRIVGTMAIK